MYLQVRPLALPLVLPPALPLALPLVLPLVLPLALLLALPLARSRVMYGSQVGVFRPRQHCHPPECTQGRQRQRFLSGVRTHGLGECGCNL